MKLHTLRLSNLSRLIDVGISESMPAPSQPFVDYLRISTSSGSGGSPVMGATRSQSFKGPGYGGHGGGVYLTASSSVESLSHIPSEARANSGGDAVGGSRGSHAVDLALTIPLGTILRERLKVPLSGGSGKALRKPRFTFQFLKDGESMTLISGGLGGIASTSFKKNDGRKPEQGETKFFELEMRAVSDCALIGAPNSGKTALMAAITRTLSRVGPEEGSTVRPHGGKLKFRDGWETSLLDLPGLRAGAADDCVSGRRVLRHTWRSKLLLYVVDVSSGSDPLHTLEMLRREILSYDPVYFFERKWIIVGTKCDLLHRDTFFRLDSLQIQANAQLSPDVEVIGVSARFGLGIRELCSAIRRALDQKEFGLSSLRTRSSEASRAERLPAQATISSLRAALVAGEASILVSQ